MTPMSGGYMSGVPSRLPRPILALKLTSPAGTLLSPVSFVPITHSTASCSSSSPAVHQRITGHRLSTSCRSTSAQVGQGMRQHHPITIPALCHTFKVHSWPNEHKEGGRLLLVLGSQQHRSLQLWQFTSIIYALQTMGNFDEMQMRHIHHA